MIRIFIVSMVIGAVMSETKEIENPYYGDEMLTCGTVEEKIQ